MKVQNIAARKKKSWIKKRSSKSKEMRNRTALKRSNRKLPSLAKKRLQGLEMKTMRSLPKKDRRNLRSIARVRNMREKARPKKARNGIILSYRAR